MALKVKLHSLSHPATYGPSLSLTTAARMHGGTGPYAYGIGGTPPGRPPPSPPHLGRQNVGAGPDAHCVVGAVLAGLRGVDVVISDGAQLAEGAVSSGELVDQAAPDLDLNLHSGGICCGT